VRGATRTAGHWARAAVLSLAFLLIFGFSGGAAEQGETASTDTVEIWFEVLAPIDVVVYAALETRTDHSGIEAHLLKDDEVEYSAEPTGSDGRVEFAGVIAGEYTLSLNAAGFLATAVLDVPVIQGAQSQVGTEVQPVLLVAGDLNHNDRIGLMDLTLLRQRYDQEVEGHEDWAHYDLNQSGRVGLMDLTILRQNYDKNTDDDATYNYEDSEPFFGDE